MRKALTSGISRQDGAYLAQLLIEKGYGVTVTSRDAQMWPFGNLERFGIRHSVRLESIAPTDFRSVLLILHRVEPDEVSNLSGQRFRGAASLPGRGYCHEWPHQNDL